MSTSIFGHKGNEEITKGLISAILKRDIKRIRIEGETILEKDLKDDKVGILDIKSDIDDKEITNIEMQVVQQDDIDKRLMFYWSKLYYGGIQAGQEYENLQKTIAILIANFEEGRKETKKEIICNMYKMQMKIEKIYVK